MNDNDKPGKDEELESAPVFYYSREHRLSHAPPEVQALNEEKNARLSLSKRLFGNKGNILILMSVLLIYVMFTITSRSSSTRSEVKFGGNTVELTVIHEEEVLMLRILKTSPKRGESFIGAVDIAVFPAIPETPEGETLRVFGHRIFFGPTDIESFIISLPFDDDEFYVVLSTDNEQKAVRVK